MKNTKIVNFLNEVLGEVRVVVTEAGEPWFVASDLCSALGYSGESEALEKVSIDYYRTISKDDYLDTPLSQLWDENDPSYKVIVNEAGMWQLILGSYLYSTAKLRDLIFEHVLPSIRSNGGYILAQEDLNEDDQKKMNKTLRQLAHQVRFNTKHTNVSQDAGCSN